MLKHVGRIKNNQKKVIVAYRTLPDDPQSCVIVQTETLESADHDSLINLVESNAGQTAYEFAEAMSRSTLSDGSNMLARFHTTGKMIKYKTSEVEMIPTTNSVITLDELNKVIADQKGVSIEDLALKNPKDTTKKENIETVNTTATETAINETTDSVLTDEQLAANYRSQADQMFKEAKRLREEAEKLVPTKKKKTQ